MLEIFWKLGMLTCKIHIFRIPQLQSRCAECKNARARPVYQYQWLSRSMKKRTFYCVRNSASSVSSVSGIIAKVVRVKYCFDISDT